MRPFMLTLVLPPPLEIVYDCYTSRFTVLVLILYSAHVKTITLVHFCIGAQLSLVRLSVNFN